MLVHQVSYCRCGIIRRVPGLEQVGITFTQFDIGLMLA